MANSFVYNALNIAAAKAEARKKHLGVLEFDDASLPGGIIINESLAVAIENAEIPGRSVTTIEINYLNGIIKQAGGAEPLEDLSVTFVDYIDTGGTGFLTIRQQLEMWFNLILEESSGLMTPPAIYKSNATLILLDGQGNTDMTYELIGLWPKKRPSVGFNYTEKDKVMIEMDFSVDYCRAGRLLIHDEM